MKVFYNVFEQISKLRQTEQELVISEQKKILVERGKKASDFPSLGVCKDCR